MRDRLRRYRVLVDGRQVGALAAGQSLTTDLPAGTHTIVIAIDWGRSEEIAFEIDGEAVSFACAPGGSLTRAPQDLAANPDTYVALWRTNPAASP